MGYLSQFIKENLLGKKNYKYFPKTKENLKAIIKKRIKEEGNEVDLNDIDTSKINDMSSLFRDTGFNGDISKWDVSNVTLMLGMFDNCVIEEKYKPKFTKAMEDKITIKKENILNAYKSASEEQKKLLKNIFGNDMFKPKDIRERIKTFHDAYCELGNEHPFVKSYEKYVNTASGEEAEVIAYLQLRIISTALNEGWEPQFTKDEHHWYPWFILWDKEWMKDKCEVEKKLWPFGQNLHKTSNCNLVYVNSTVHSNAPASLAVKSEELATYFGKQFIEIWSYYLLSTGGRKLKFEE